MTDNKVHILEPAILIRINQFYREGMSNIALYEATRGVWRVGKNREKANIAIAVYNGQIKSIYNIKSWHPAGTTSYQTRHPDTYNIPGRWEFIGDDANSEIILKYVGKNISHYFQKGAQNPIMYLNT